MIDGRLAFDLPHQVLKHGVHILPGFGTALKILNPEHIGQFLPLIGRDLPLLLGTVILIRDKDHHALTILPEVLHPLRYAQIRVTVCDGIHQDDAHRATVVGTSYCPVFLLAGGVPDL